ncbi:MAG: hypothetical protein ABJL44_11335 [Algibacter sp.]
MEDKISVTIDYYKIKRKEILDFVNNNRDLTPDVVIEKGEALAILEYKITALQVALEN